MAYSVNEAWIQTFKEGIDVLSQQTNSVFENTVKVDTRGGENLFCDRVDSIDFGDLTSSNQATTFTDVPHTKRSVDFVNKTLNLYVDQRDTERMLTDPTSAYMVEGVASYKRIIDDTVITAMLAAANEGKAIGAAFTTVAFDTANQVIDAAFQDGDPVGDGNGTSGDTYGTGDYLLTLAKILRAKAILHTNHAVGAGEKVYCAISPLDEIALLNIPEFKNRDFSDVTPYDLMINPDGYIGKWAGIHWLRSTRLPITDPAGANNQYRSCFMYTDSAILLRKPRGLQVNVVGNNAERNMATTINMQFGVGAVRLEEKKVVQIRTSGGFAGQDAS